jgi:hypothetical protein
MLLRCEGEGSEWENINRRAHVRTQWGSMTVGFSACSCKGSLRGSAV